MLATQSCAMAKSDDIEYLKVRYRQANELAEAADDFAIRNIHRAMAQPMQRKSQRPKAADKLLA